MELDNTDAVLATWIMREAETKAFNGAEEIAVDAILEVSKTQPEKARTLFLRLAQSR